MMKKQILITLISVCSLCGAESIEDLQKIISKENMYIFNVVELNKYHIAILKDDDSLEYNNENTIIVAAFDSVNNLIEYKLTKNNAYPFSPAYYIKDNIFLLIVNMTLLKFDSDIGHFQNTTDYGSAVVYIDGDYIYSESGPPGITIWKFELNTLSPISSYKTKSSNMNKFFHCIDEIYMKPGDRKNTLIIQFTELLKIKLLQNK